MQAIFKSYEWLLNALKVCSMIVIFSVFILIISDVIMSVLVTINRKLQWFGPSLGAWDGTHGVVEYGMLWFTMLAAPWLARTKGHVFIDAITELMSPAIQKIAAKFSYSVALIVSIAFTYYSWLLLKEAFQDQMVDERGIDIPQWVLYFPMPICFGLVSIEFLRYLLGFDDMYDKRTNAREGM